MFCSVMSYLKLSSIERLLSRTKRIRAAFHVTVPHSKIWHVHVLLTTDSLIPSYMILLMSCALSSHLLYRTTGKFPAIIINFSYTILNFKLVILCFRFDALHVFYSSIRYIQCLSCLNTMFLSCLKLLNCFGQDAVLRPTISSNKTYIIIYNYNIYHLQLTDV